MEYEDVVKMIGHLQAASDLCFGRDDDLPEGISDELMEIQNMLNDHRLRMLGNGRDRPFDVDDLLRASRSSVALRLGHGF